MKPNDELDAAWKEMFPLRPPHKWSDEGLVIAALFERRLKKLEHEIRKIQKKAYSTECA